MDVVEFILSLKDGASHPLGNMSKEALGSKFSMEKLGLAVDKVRGITEKTGNSIGSVREKIKKLQEMKELLPVNAIKQIKQVNHEIENLEKGLSKLDGKAQSGGTGGGLMSGIMGHIPALAIGGSILGSINEGMKNSSQKLDFEMLLGGQSGGAVYDGLKRMKGLLGDGVYDLGEMLTESMDASKIVPVLTELGDVAGRDHGKLATLAGAFGQLNKEGKLTEATLAAMEQGGFKPLVAISETTGQSLNKVRQRFLDGKVSIQEVERALKASTEQGGRYYGVMEQIANSPQGTWNTLVEKVSELAGNLGEKLLPIAMDVVDFLIAGFELVEEPLSLLVEWFSSLYNWVKSNSEVIAPLAIVLGAFAGGIWAVIAAKTAWITITTSLTTSITAMSASIMAIPVIGWILAAIAAIIAAVVYLRNHFTGFLEFFKNMWEQAEAYFSIFVSYLKQGFEWVTYQLNYMKLVFQNFGEFAAGLFNNISKAIELALDFKFSEAKDALTAKFTTTADGEIEVLKSGFQDSKKGFDKERQDAHQKILDHPLAGIIRRKGEEADAAERATGGGKYGKNGTATPTSDLRHGGVKDSINAISGGGVKNITVTVGKMFEHVEYNIQNGTKQLALEIERISEEAVTRAIASASAK